MSRRCNREEPRQRLKRDSPLTMLFKGIKHRVKDEKKSVRKPTMGSRSIAPRAIAEYEDYDAARGIDPDALMECECFFDEATGTSHKSKSFNFKTKKRPKPEPSFLPKKKKPILPQTSKQTKSSRPLIKKQVAPQTETSGFAIKSNRRVRKQEREDRRRRGFDTDDTDSDEDEADGDDIGLLQQLQHFENSDRSRVGLTLLSKMFGGGPSAKDIDLSKTGRSFFTWWIVLIHVVIYITAVVLFGIAPYGVGSKEIKGEVLMSSLVIEQVSITVDTNIWVGPSQADLIHLGAKYSPCMRYDVNIENVLAIDASVEKETACCIRNDGSGCVQKLESDCSTSLNTWKKWTENDKGFQDRTSGSVCGQDPEYCLEPASTGAFIWEDDITKWPLCETTANVSKNSDNRHMTCEVVGRPCCIGIQGECVLTTREYCDFVDGYFHQEAALCSQVNCMGEICGMIPFLNPDEPDQFYRLFSSLFLHAGLGQLICSLIFNLIWMREFEKIIGTMKMMLIYLGSGTAASLASAVFLPYSVECGPSGATYGVIALMFVEVIRWTKDKNPARTIGILGAILIVLFLVGLLPYMDNWAHLFGFFFGLMLSLAVRPYQKLCGKELSTPAKVLWVVVFMTFAIGIFALVVILFYMYPITECSGCKYFNCIPFTDGFCDSSEVTITRNTTTTTI